MPRDIDLKDVARRLERIEDVLRVGSPSRAVECALILRGNTAGTGSEVQPKDLGQEQSITLALQDASLILDAFNGLMAPTEFPGARERLRRALSGPTVVVPEEGPDHPRNELWELCLAARFREQGFDPKFGDEILPPESKKPDLIIKCGGIRLAVEAKRVRAMDALAPRVEKATSQVVAACSLGVADFGFLALDVSFAAQQNAQHGWWTLPNAAAKGSVKSQLLPGLRTLSTAIDLLIGADPGGGVVLGTSILVLPVVFYSDVRRLSLVRYFFSSRYGNRPTKGLEALDAVFARCFSDA